MKKTIRPLGHVITRLTHAGAILAIAVSASAQNLFVSDSGSGNLYEYTPGGVRSTFATGLGMPVGLAFNNAGVLYAAVPASGNVYAFSAGGVQSTFASGVAWPWALAVNSVGNLFVANAGDYGSITEITGITG